MLSSAHDEVQHEAAGELINGLLAGIEPRYGAWAAAEDNSGGLSAGGADLRKRMFVLPRAKRGRRGWSGAGGA